MRWITVADIATLYRLPVQRIYWLAHSRRWRRTGTKPIGYWVEDVERDLRNTRVNGA